jgi:ATP-dependent Clp protease adapter protein ClpS
LSIQLVDETEVQGPDTGVGGWVVVVYNNDVNTWDEVISVLRRATGCTEEQAEIETWEIHNLGKSVVHHGRQGECERAAAIIRSIGIKVDVIED